MSITFKRASRVSIIALVLVMGTVLQVLAQGGETAAVPANALSTDAAVIAEGKKIFDSNCSQCHAVHEQVVGPQLSAVYERQSIDWLHNFIKYPEKTINSGDPHAVELFKEFQQVMPNHDFLTDADINAILSYVQDETLNPPIDDDDDVVVVNGKPANSDLLVFIIGGLVVLLLIMLSVVFMLISTLTRYLRQEDGLTEHEQVYLTEKFQIGKIIGSQPFLVAASFIFLVIMIKVLIDGLFTVGVQQGYAPDQPIQFSHKLHAGYYEIPCQYCHTGVEKAKSANIPSANICMNCHGELRTGSPEIQKIYASIENNAPIKWVRVHNLPDLAYFNHSQHVKVGGIECETCHGDIKEMEVVQQHSLLTMGWCIACHRKTEVQVQDNPYYENLVKYYETTPHKGNMKVEDIGGLECSKCHY